MKPRYLLIIVLIAIVVIAAVGLNMYFKKHDDVNKMKADFTVEAPALIQEFEQQEAQATTKYSEKVLEITGKLASKNQLSNGTTLLMLEDEMQGISCQLDSSWSKANRSVIESLEPGSTVKVKGICKGYLMEIKVSPAVVVH